MKRIWLRIVEFFKGFRLRKMSAASRGSVVNHEVGSFRIVTGASGTGKTSIMRAEAGEIMKTLPDSRVLVITSSERVAESFMSLPGYDSIRHFAGSARALICRMLPTPTLSAREDLMVPLLDYLDSHTCSLPQFTHIFIDEAQNLSPALLRIIERLKVDESAPITCFLDPAQAIFGFLGASSETISLLRAKAGKRVVKLKMRRRPMPVVLPELIAVDSEKAVELAVRKALTIRNPGETAAILTRTNSEAAEASHLLDEQGIQHTTLSAQLISANDTVAPDSIPRWRYFALRHADRTPTCNDGITIATVHTFRDRTADHVIVLDTALKLPADDAAPERRRLHTGICRATKTAVVIKIPSRNLNSFPY